jgi:hypothetical protein
MKAPLFVSILFLACMTLVGGSTFEIYKRMSPAEKMAVKENIAFAYTHSWAGK